MSVSKFIVTIVLILIGILILLYFIFTISNSSKNFFNEKYNETLQHMPGLPIIILSRKRAGIPSFVIYLIIAIVLILVAATIYVSYANVSKSGINSIFEIANKTTS